MPHHYQLGIKRLDKNPLDELLAMQKAQDSQEESTRRANMSALKNFPFNDVYEKEGKYYRTILTENGGVEDELITPTQYAQFQEQNLYRNKLEQSLGIKPTVRIEPKEQPEEPSFAGKVAGYVKNFFSGDDKKPEATTVSKSPPTQKSTKPVDLSNPTMDQKNQLANPNVSGLNIGNINNVGGKVKTGLMDSKIGETMPINTIKPPASPSMSPARKSSGMTPAQIRRFGTVAMGDPKSAYERAQRVENRKPQTRDGSQGIIQPRLSLPSMAKENQQLEKMVAMKGVRDQQTKLPEAQMLPDEKIKSVGEILFPHEYNDKFVGARQMTSEPQPRGKKTPVNKDYKGKDYYDSYGNKYAGGVARRRAITRKMRKDSFADVRDEFKRLWALTKKKKFIR
jgi:hypothetical protein